MAIQIRSYCYLIVNTIDKTAVAVDAAWDIAGILDLAEQLGVKMRGSIYTHFHFDHCGGVDKNWTRGRRIDGAKEVQDTGGEIWAGINDVELIKKQCGLTSEIVGLNDGDAIDCGDLALHILHTPGHSPGSICIFAAPRGLSPRGDLRGSKSVQLKQAVACSSQATRFLSAAVGPRPFQAAVRNIC